MSYLAFDIGQQLNLGNTNISSTPYQQGFLPFFWTIIKNLYILTGIVLFFFIVAGGLGMIINAGNAEKQKQSSKTVTSAVIGYLIMFAAYWIIKIIEALSGQDIFF